MKKQLSIHDLQALSALLDGKLSQHEKSRLESRLSKEADLREALEGLRRTRILLHNSPKIRAPHNFTLTRQMAGIQEKLKPGFIYPFLKFSTVLASILFVFALLGDFIVKQPLPTAPLQAKEMVPAAQSVEEYTAQQEEMEMMAPTMTPMPVAGRQTEAAVEKSFDLSNAPMEPLPTTIPSALVIEPTSEVQEAPMLAAAPEEFNTQTQETITASSVEGELAAGSGIAMTETEVMADQAMQTEELTSESPMQTAVMGNAERSKMEQPQTGVNIWRILEIIFGSLIVIFGISILVYRAKKNHDNT